jgi:rhodanese-related sulfurtransferase
MGKNSKKAKQKNSKVPIWAWIAGGIVMALVVILVVSNPGASAQSLPSEVSVKEAQTMVANGAFLLDVREQSEWVAGHVQGATLIPLGDLPNRLSELPKDAPIVVMCRTGHRSAQGRDILLQAGFTQVTSMSGGITEWIAEGNPVVTGN